MLYGGQQKDWFMGGWRPKSHYFVVVLTIMASIAVLLIGGFEHSPGVRVFYILTVLVFLVFILLIYIGFRKFVTRRGKNFLNLILDSNPYEGCITDRKANVIESSLSNPENLKAFFSNYFTDPDAEILKCIRDAESGHGIVTVLGDDCIFLSTCGRNRFLWITQTLKKNYVPKAADLKSAELTRKKYIRSSKGELSIQFDSFPVALLLISNDGQILHCNCSARILLGISSICDLHFHEIFDGLGRPVNNWLDDILKGDIKESAEVLHLISSSGEKFIHIFLNKIVINHRAMALAVLTDGSSFKRIELQFNQSQKMQAIGQLAGGISHDFNNLLTAISGYCDLLLMNKDQNDPDYYDLGQIRQNTNRAASLVSQLLAFSRKQPLQTEIIDANQILAEVGHLLNRLLGENFTLIHRLTVKPAMICVDKRRIEQALINLVLNARDAMPSGGDIIARIDHHTIGSVEKHVNFEIKSGQYVRIQIIDKGDGIRPENIPRIFDPFFTTKPAGQGTGLGLSTVYGIVKQSNGFIYVDSELSKGTTFTILLPLHKGELLNNNVRNKNLLEAPANRSLGILIVDDEHSIRELLSRSFARLGYHTYPFDNVESASRFLAKSQHRVGTIITDIIMPDANGIDWARHARDISPDIRIIFISGYADESIIEETKRMPNTKLINKPFKISELIELLPEKRKSEFQSSE